MYFNPLPRVPPETAHRLMRLLIENLSLSIVEIFWDRGYSNRKFSENINIGYCSTPFILQINKIIFDYFDIHYNLVVSRDNHSVFVIHQQHDEIDYKETQTFEFVGLKITKSLETHTVVVIR